MGRLVKCVCVLLVSMLLAGCATSSPRTFERVVADAEQNGQQYSQEDWNRADESFEHFCQRYDYDQLQKMSEEEQREVGRLMARYTKARAKSAMKELDGFIKTGVTLLEGFLEGLGLEVEEDKEN